jgi:predicted amidohydrolase
MTGATIALFVPTNNGLPPNRAGVELVAQARKCDMASAVENSMWVIRADVAGHAGGLTSYGSSGIVDPEGIVVREARQMSEDLIIADIDTVGRARRRGGDASRNRPIVRHPSWSDQESC